MITSSGRQQELREQLLRQRRQIAGLSRAEWDAVQAGASASEGPHDAADASAVDLETDINLALLEMRSETLAHIDDALARLQNGAYGFCEDCGAEIAVARLIALPAAERCRSCEGARESSSEKWQPFGADRPPQTPFATRDE